MFDTFFHWFRYSTLLEKAIVLTIILIISILLAGAIDPSNTRADRKTFCLDRGYDKYEISQGHFYCKNKANGNIKKFPDPIKKGVKAERRSWE